MLLYCCRSSWPKASSLPRVLAQKPFSGRRCAIAVLLKINAGLVVDRSVLMVITEDANAVDGVPRVRGSVCCV